MLNTFSSNIQIHGTLSPLLIEPKLFFQSTFLLKHIFHYILKDLQDINIRMNGTKLQHEFVKGEKMYEEKTPSENTPNKAVVIRPKMFLERKNVYFTKLRP